MPIDASIYNAFAPRVQSPMEVQNALMQQANAGFDMRAKQDAYAQEQAQQEAVRQSGGDPAALRQALVQRGLIKGLNEHDKTQAQILRDQASASKDTSQGKGYDLDNIHKVTQQLAERWGAVQKPEDVVPLYAQAVRTGLLPFSAANAGIMEVDKIKNNPAQFQAYVLAQRQQGMKVAEQMRQALDLREFGLKANNELIGPDGQVNQPLLAAKQSIAKHGAANTSIKIDNALGGGLAKEVGPLVEASFQAAKGAETSISNAAGIIKAVDSGKVIAGPAATLRLRGAQVADMLGIGGKDNAEKIANTRAVIQGLAQSVVSARGQLKGQGQVSDFEGRLLARATAGEIDELTPAEVKQLAQISTRLSKQIIAQHGQLITKLRAHPAAAPLADLFETNPGLQQPAAPSGQGDWKVVR